VKAYLGNLNFKRRLIRHAIKFYDESLKMKADQAKVWNLKGIAHRRLKEHENALSAFKRAVAINPKYSEAFNNIGNIYQAMGDFSRAIEFYNRSLEMDAKNQGTIRNRRICINKLQRAELWS